MVRALRHERYTRVGDYLRRLDGAPNDPVASAAPATATERGDDRDGALTAPLRELERRLGRATWRFFGALSRFPGPFSVDSAAQAAGVDRAAACLHLGALVNVYLVCEAASPDTPDPAPCQHFRVHVAARWFARWARESRST